MLRSSVCLLAASLVVVAAMPSPGSGEMSGSKAMCHAALDMNMQEADMPAMAKCCSTETQLTEDQCRMVLHHMNEKKTMKSDMRTESMPEPEPEAESSAGYDMEEMAEGYESMEGSHEEGNTESSMEGYMFTMEMMAAQPTIKQCTLKAKGMLSAEGTVNESAVRLEWTNRVLPSAGEEHKMKLMAAIDTCPLTTKQDMMVFPKCLVKTCAYAA